VLYLPFIGGVQLRSHRPLPDGFKLKTVQAIEKADGWYVNLCIEDPTVPEFSSEVVPTWDNSIGMDTVLHEDDFLALSDGQKLPSLKSFRKTQFLLAGVSKRKANRKRGSNRRRKLAKREARIHQPIARSCQERAFKTAHKVVKSGHQVYFHIVWR
jgi:putative transposase